MGGFKAPEAVHVSASEYLEDLAELDKDLADGEEVCGHCAGTGLVKVDSRYGLKGDPGKGLAPYSRQSVSFCQHCFNGVARRCSKCGGLIPKGSIACKCDEKERWEEKQAERWQKAKKVPAKDYDGPVYYSDEFYRSVDDFMEWYRGEDGLPPLSAITGVYAAEEAIIALNADTIIDMLSESDMAYEDYMPDNTAVACIKAFCRMFNSTYADTALLPSSVGISFEER